MKVIGCLKSAVPLVLIPSTHSFYVILSYFLSFLLNLSRIGPDLFPLYYSTAIGPNATYDFIVIGSGPTGSVLANRLTENGRWTVLLLESGDEASVIADIPVVAGAIEFTRYNWGYKSEPQEELFCRGCIDGRMEYPHGKVMGGSSTINYMIYTRGNKLDYDRWAAMGNPGWSYEEVLPYFLKSEDAHIASKDARYHHEGGYLGVSDVPYRSEVSGVYIKAAEEAGHSYVDYNGAKQLGVSYTQSTTKGGRRTFAEKAFIRPIRKRKNLRVQSGCKVSRILIDSTATARGVEYISKGKTYEAFARKEVILSAGALNSPQVLMLSGIGPRDHLNSLGIPVLKNLPVGRQLYDHASYPALVFTLNESIALHQISSLINPLTYPDFLFRGKGFLTVIGGVEAITYIRTNVSTDPDPSYPDVELFVAGGSLSTDFGLFYRKKFNIPPATFNKFFLPLEFRPNYQIFPLLLHPKSVGHIELRSRNPLDAPKFYANYFSDPENHDVKTLIAAIREAQRINESPALQKYGAKLVSTPVPGCENLLFNSDQYWECCLRTIIGSEYHQTATCRMGTENDIHAVVDAKLKVHGIENLRVADTSVIPITISGHTVAVAYMIGERAADIIKEDYQ